MPFKTFNNWLFDGNIKSEIPKPDPENNVPDILKYNSPISSTYAISLFLKCGRFNHYLDKYFNNINLRYIDKREMFHYIKEQVCKMKIKRYQIYYTRRTRKTKLFEILRDKLPYLKDNDISSICNKVDASDKKDDIYNSIGITKPKREKFKKKKIKERNKISLNDFLRETFTIMDV